LLDSLEIRDVKDDSFGPILAVFLFKLVQLFFSPPDDDQLGIRSFEKDAFGHGMAYARGGADEENFLVVEVGHFVGDRLKFECVEDGEQCYGESSYVDDIEWLYILGTPLPSFPY